MNFRETADRVIVTKKTMVKGREVTKSTSLPTRNQIVNIIDWMRDAIGPVTLHNDEATIRREDPDNNEYPSGLTDHD